MTDADLIYNALLRAEKRLEDLMQSVAPDAAVSMRSSLIAVEMVREEIGNGLARESR